MVLLAAALLRLVNLGSWSLWNDELYTLLILPVSPLLAEGIPVDQHPPLYYMFLEEWLVLSTTEFIMRLPSAVAGWLAILLMWRTGYVLGGNRLGLLAAVLLALSPLHIWYSREARMYGPATFFWLAAMYCYVQLIYRNRWLFALGLAAAMVAGMYTAYPSLALWITQLVLFLPSWHWRGRPVGLVARWLVAQVIIIAGLVVWWPFLQAQLARNSPFSWLGMSLSLAETFQIAMVGAGIFVLAGSILALLVVRRPVLLARLWRWLFPAAILIVLLFVILTGLSATGRGLSIRRQLLVFWPPFVLLTAWGILQLNNRRVEAAVIGLSLVLGLWSAFGPAYEDWRGAAELVESLAEPGDQVLVATGGALVALDHYLTNELGYEAEVPQDLEQQPPEPGSHVWLVTNDHPSSAGVKNPIIKWFEGHGVLQSTHYFSRYITVKEYWMP